VVDAEPKALQDDWRAELTAPQRRHLRTWLWSIAAMTLAVLVVGGITRLTHSGLSIVDWQPIVGVVPPVDEGQWQETFARYRRSPEYLQLRQGMTLPEFKYIFFWEYLHRLLARGIGLVFLLPCSLFALRGYFNRALAIRAAVLFGLGALQGVMGWLMVTSGLVDRPSVSHYRLAAHLGLAFVIVGWCVWLAQDLRTGIANAGVGATTRRLITRGLTLVGVLLCVQILWGGFVAGLKAGLVFNTFPLMAGNVLPPDLLALRPALVNFVQNPIAVQWTHRLLATLLAGVAIEFFRRVRQSKADTVSRQLNTALLALVVGQYGLGVLTLVYYVPVALAVMHQATALVMFAVWVAWTHHARHLVVIDPTARVEARGDSHPRV
jgi:cytochrome c oxidase assembly protein subunit 15